MSDDSDAHLLEGSSDPLKRSKGSRELFGTILLPKGATTDACGAAWGECRIRAAARLHLIAGRLLRVRFAWAATACSRGTRACTDPAARAWRLRQPRRPTRCGHRCRAQMRGTLACACCRLTRRTFGLYTSASRPRSSKVTVDASTTAGLVISLPGK